MPRYFFNSENCRGATSGATGRHYNADRDGFIHVEDKADIATLTAGGYIQAGGLPKFRKYWVCDDCNWDSAINHCRYCDSTSLRKVEK